MEYLNKLLTPVVVNSFGMMILHMLWQGLIITMMLGIFLIIMKKSSAQSRYIISVISVFLFPVTSLVTFIKVYSSFKLQQELIINHIATATSLEEGGGLMQSFIDVYRQYLPVVVFIWFLGMTILLLRYLGLLIYVERLKNYLVQPVTDKLISKIDQISKKFQVKKNIKSLVSSKITTPMIIGHFKPVLLLPKITIEKLSDEEMDVVLQHELAHVKRNDYLVNIFQNIIEIMFFFHPGMWWTSSIVRKEREECCDIFAIQDEKDKITLANALATIHELNNKIPNMALSFLNNKNGLFNRINNLFGKPGMATFKEGLVVAFFFFLSISLMSFIITGNKADKCTEELSTISGELANGEHLFAKIDSTGTIKKLFVEGKSIKGKKMNFYQPDVDSIRYFSGLKDKDSKFEYKANNLVINKKGEDKDIDFDFDYDDDKISPEEIHKMKKEMLEALDEVNKELGLNINIDDENSKVTMKANDNGFTMDVSDGKDKVKMDFGPNGIYMHVEENGKTVFHMNIDDGSFEFSVDDSSKGKKVKEK